MKSKRNLSWIFFISTFISWFIPCSLWASVQVDGIYYDLNTSAKTAAVAPNPDYYTGVIDIPSNFVYEGNTYNVTSIGYCAFLDCEGVTTVNMPNSVTTIENSAFERSTGLTELNIGVGVTTIKTESFKNCINLVSLTLPKSLKSIGPESFAGCSSLTKIIEERTTPPTIISTTFNGVDKSTCKVYVPAGCRSTYANASYWKSFSNIEERAVVATGSCGKSVTYTIYSDMSMVISGTGEMSDYMGETPHIDATYYQKIESVVIEDGVTSIGEFAFYDFIRLTSLRIASSVTKIGNAAFYECTSLTSLIIPSSVTEIGNGAFYGCHELTSLVIPDGVKVIRPVLFFNCTGLTSVTIPNGVTEIGYAAFECCSSLTSVAIPSSVNSIGDAAFELCSGLTSITVENETPVEITSATFNNVDKANCTLYVPAGSKSAYKSAEVWKEFGNIEEFGEDYVLGDANNDGRVNVSDFTAIASCILGTPPATFVEKAADVNADGTINVADLTGVANIILHGAAEPNALNAKTRNDVASEFANIEANDITVALDEEFTVVININGNFAYSGYQFDIALPDGLTVKEVSEKSSSSDLFLSDMINDNTLRVLYASTIGEVVESRVVYLTLMADSEGTYNVDIDNAIVSANASPYFMSKRSVLISVGSNTSGLSLSNEPSNSGVAYDVTGKMWKGDMSRLPKGVYLINGKKVIK